MAPDPFAVFILSHGRPTRVYTYHTLQQCGYTGRVYIVIDNEDSSIEQYREIFGDQVIVFDKEAIANTFDEGDNSHDRRAVVYARNACFQIAQDLGIEFFLELDDDYTGFNYWLDSRLQYVKRNPSVLNLDSIFSAFLSFYKSIPAKSIALAQSGDFIGGGETNIFESINHRRKCMNSFFCSVGRPFAFVGRINEDVNTYVWYQGLGNLFLTIPSVGVHQVKTQLGQGGMTDLYLEGGTYVKSFYTVMYAPSCTEVRMMGSKHKRLHHSISWDHAVPCILSEQYRQA